MVLTAPAPVLLSSSTMSVAAIAAVMTAGAAVQSVKCAATSAAPLTASVPALTVRLAAAAAGAVWTVTMPTWFSRVYYVSPAGYDSVTLEDGTIIALPFATGDAAIIAKLRASLVLAQGIVTELGAYTASVPTGGPVPTTADGEPNEFPMSTTGTVVAPAWNTDATLTAEFSVFQ